MASISMEGADHQNPAIKKKTPKKKEPLSAKSNTAPMVGPQPLPEVKYPGNQDESKGSSKKTSKGKASQATKENIVTITSDSMPDVGSQSPTVNAKSPKKAAKGTVPFTTYDKTRISGAESLPEVRVSRTVPRKGRVVPSRYKESAKNRAVATPTKSSDASCISINQSKLFATATSSTPVSEIEKRRDVVSRRKPPPKMAPLSAPVPDGTTHKFKKTSKTATIKVKPMRAVDAAAKIQSDTDRLPEHELLYNQYLQWQYLCRMSEVSLKKEVPQLNYQARQLSGLVEGTRRDVLERERKLQAVTVYREMVQLEKQVAEVLAAINASADTVRGDLSRLTTILDASRNRLQLKSFLEPADGSRFTEELLEAAVRCRDCLSALDEATAPSANLLRHTAESVGSLQRSLQDGLENVRRSAELAQELNSLVLQEASLVVGCSAQRPETPPGSLLLSQ